jgi:hypothetical protein
MFVPPPTYPSQKYHIEQADSPQELQTAVSQRLAGGWKASGGPFVFPVATPEGVRNCLCQALVRD